MVVVNDCSLYSLLENRCIVIPVTTGIQYLCGAWVHRSATGGFAPNDNSIRLFTQSRNLEMKHNTKYEIIRSMQPHEVCNTMKIILLILTFATCISTSSSQQVQWANKVVGYSTPVFNKAYSAYQALGSPSVMPEFGATPCAWTLYKNQGNAEDWLHVQFKNPIHVRQIVINENLNPGAVRKILLYDEQWKGYLVYDNDDIPLPNTKGRTLNILIDKTTYKVKYLRIILRKFSDNHQIDAIGISESDIPYKVKINIATDTTKNFQLENLGPNINTKFDEIGPIISSDGKRIYFTRQSEISDNGPKGDQDIWFSDMDSTGKFTPAVNIGPPINNKGNNFAISVSQDGNSLIVGNVYYADGSSSRGLSLSHYNGYRWTFPTEIRIDDFENKNQYVNYCIGSNGKDMIIAMENDASFGDLDLYVSHLRKNGRWSKPENLGYVVNTAAREGTPLLASDGQSLYYFTSGHPGYGQGDLFVTRRLDDTWKNWSKPQNLGPIINSSGFDGYYTIPASGEYAYFVSIRNSYGEGDIFRIRLNDAIKPKEVVLISGKTLNAKTNHPIEAKIIYETLPDGVESGIANSNPKTGEYSIVLPVGSKYGFLAIADGFVSVNENLDLREINSYKEINKDLFLVPIEQGQIVRLNNIFFEFGKYELLEDSFSELNRVIEFLNNNPGIKIEIQGHTDIVGSKQNNMRLSLNRAKAVAGYLVSKGIQEDRIKTKGLGKSKPLASNATAEGRKKNRRVEFVIISK